ncbi:hypothetical protein CPB84DRAFT_1859163 [Gymnopilus junonius]|uniref:Uncharacterized protein n=1 Tax=Gymnopilus junonius TaxID=109634 RepID=A0A9P5N6X3_GYMJU|nr:hypothetical protein CPB84DRAFT_1859163 [Gymnopilus junonius]
MSSHSRDAWSPAWGLETQQSVAAPFQIQGLNLLPLAQQLSIAPAAPSTRNQHHRLAKHAASAPNLSSSLNLQYCSPSSPPTAGPSNISSSQPAVHPSPSSPSKQDTPPTSDLNKGCFKYCGYRSNYKGKARTDGGVM